MKLDSLPTEILARCFECLGNFYDAQKDLKDCRLVCRRFSGVVVPYLFYRFTTYISLDSLVTLEEISQHPLIAKSIKHVEFNLSFYDEFLAQDIALFARARAGDLGPVIQSSPIPMRHRAIQVESEWRAIGEGEQDYVWNTITPNQAIIRDTHQEYRCRFENQELAKQDPKRALRIATALQSFTALRKVSVTDTIWRKVDQTKELSAYEEDGSDKEHENWRGGPFSRVHLKTMCLKPFRWSAYLDPAEGKKLQPPVQLLPEIFTTLERSATFPISCLVCITPPDDLGALQLSPEKLKTISSSLRKTKNLAFEISWFGHFNSRDTYDTSEMQHLGNLISAFFNVDAVESLNLAFDGYLLDGPPQISLTQIVPLQKQNWEHLRRFRITYVPFHEHEARVLAERCGKTLRELDIQNPYLLSGTWRETLEHLRCLDNLEQVEFVGPMGGELGDFSQPYYYDDQEETEKYILRERNDNPLREECILELYRRHS